MSAKNISNAKVLMNINEVMEYCSVGKNTAYKIGKESGAIVKLGRRTLFKVETLQEYVNRLTSEGDS